MAGGALPSACLDCCSMALLKASMLHRSREHVFQQRTVQRMRKHPQFYLAPFYNVTSISHT
jgi:hypothetical protein